MSTATSATSSSGRRLDLDWVRIGAFGLLILYHVGMVYVPWDFHIKSPRIVEALTFPMLITNPWRLTLLFLVSGVATRFMSDKVEPGPLARLRSRRLLPPLLLGVLVIVPPQSFVEVVTKVHYAGGYLDFYKLYITAFHGFCGHDGKCLIMPTYNHLWFVAYLWVYTVLLVAVLAFAPKVVAWLDRVFARLFSGWGALLSGFIVYAAARYFLAPRFDVTHALIDDWYEHAQMLFAFLAGFCLAKSDGFWDAALRLRWVALGLAVAGYTAWATYAWVYRESLGVTPAPDVRRIMRFAFALDQWSAIVAILGFARRYLSDFDPPARRYLTDGVFPFYIIHQTVIVLGAFWLIPLHLPLAVEAGLLITLTTMACFATYELARRVAPLRLWFGLKSAPTSGSRGGEGGTVPLQSPQT